MTITSAINPPPVGFSISTIAVRLGTSAFRLWAIFALLLAALLLSGCDRGTSFRYRMTVEVETPQGLRTGSAVHEIEAHHVAISVNGTVRGRNLRGQAVAVDLPGGRTLFALMTPAEERFGSDGTIDSVLRTLDPAYDNDWVESVARVRAGEGTRRSGVIAPTVPNPYTGPSRPDQPAHFSNYPLLVTFRNLRDPASVVRVDPTDLATPFGQGTRLRRIWVEVTDDDVTTGIERRLSWLGQYPEPRLDPDYRGSTTPTLAERIAHGDFVRGE